MRAIDTLLVNSTIYTMDPTQPRASTIAVRKGQIVAVGGEELKDLAGSDIPVVDLEGRCVLPGLTDSHIHFYGVALALQRVDLTGSRSLDEMLERVAARVQETPPGEWVQGRGWDQEIWPDRRFPSAADIDRVAPHHLVALTAKSGHALVANSRALRKAGITADTPDPSGGLFQRGPDGKPTGLALEKAMDVIEEVIPQPSAEEIAETLPPAFEQAWQVGLTAVHDMASPSAARDASFGAYQLAHAKGTLGLRIVKYLPTDTLDHALALRLRSGLGDDWLRVGGIKVFMDGALGPRTAAMLEPFTGEPDNIGILVTERDALEDLAQHAVAGGLALSIHALGDRANRIILDVLSDMPSTPPLPHRIEHAQHLHPDDMGRFAALGVVASMQPVHATQDAPMVDRYLAERAATSYAWRSLTEAGAALAFGSDDPVEDLNPFVGIHAAVTRTRPDGYGGPEGWHPEQRLTVAEAVHGYTQGAAYAIGMEERLGSLSPGKWADLVVLDRDIFACEPAAIVETQVVGTMIEGKWVLSLT